MKELKMKLSVLEKDIEKVQEKVNPIFEKKRFWKV